MHRQPLWREQHGDTPCKLHTSDTHTCTTPPPLPHRAVILMESNLGMAELEELLSELGDRSKVPRPGAGAGGQPECVCVCAQGRTEA
jgi:hypothetical protein